MLVWVSNAEGYARDRVPLRVELGRSEGNFGRGLHKPNYFEFTALKYAGMHHLKLWGAFEGFAKSLFFKAHICIARIRCVL